MVHDTSDNDYSYYGDGSKYDHNSGANHTKPENVTVADCAQAYNDAVTAITTLPISDETKQRYNPRVIQFQDEAQYYLGHLRTVQDQGQEILSAHPPLNEFGFHNAEKSPFEESCEYFKRTMDKLKESVVQSIENYQGCEGLLTHSLDQSLTEASMHLNLLNYNLPQPEAPSMVSRVKGWFKRS